ncbi:MAG: restriction endonuclease subunit S, partial [Selenomonadaceae bacterium]|nr:restriction endonuclease subunit S [Selenomonadaceae bacterium]
YITLADERNTENLDAEFVRGISIDKKFIPTKADMDGVKLENYKLVKPEQFAYVADTSRRGDKISIARNEQDFSVIVSPISSVFETVKEKLLPEYLMLFFLRSEFDRYARFHSWGSAREVFSWKDLCEVEIPIPDLETQRSIAAIYEVYRTRKKILERLKAQIKAICPILIKGSLDEGATT